jgi:hypothetical protein
MKKLLAALHLVLKFKIFLIGVAVLAVLGYAAYQLSLVVAVAPNPVYVQAGTDKNSQTGVRLDPKTVSTINDLITVPTNVSTAGAGKSDPFAP